MPDSLGPIKDYHEGFRDPPNNLERKANQNRTEKQFNTQKRNPTLAKKAGDPITANRNNTNAPWEIQYINKDNIMIKLFNHKHTTDNTNKIKG